MIYEFRCTEPWSLTRRFASASPEGRGAKQAVFLPLPPGEGRGEGAPSHITT